MNVINVNHLTYKYNHNDKNNILKDVTFKVNNGEWLSIIGPNGSGKSTLVKALDGLIDFNQSMVSINGLNYHHNDNEIRSQIGIVFQNPDSQFIASTVEDDVAFGLENNNIDTLNMKKIVKKSLNLVGMYKYRNYSPNSLSGGQKQRVALAGLISVKPRIIILDEATSMLDPMGKKKILKLIDHIRKKFNLTIISITHDINEVAYSDQTLILKNGRIVKKANSSKILSNMNLLKNNGLEIPFYQELYCSLKNKNVNLPSKIMNEEDLFNWIVQLISKM